MAPRAEIDNSNESGEYRVAYDIGGRMLLVNPPDPRVKYPMHLEPEPFPEGVRLDITPDQYCEERRKADAIEPSRLLLLASQATRVTLRSTPIHVEDTNEQIFIITSPSRPVTELLRLFFDTHGRRMSLSREHDETAGLTLTVYGGEDFSNFGRILVVDRAIFRTEDRKS
jgi:hypothetical protein